MPEKTSKKNKRYKNKNGLFAFGILIIIILVVSGIYALNTPTEQTQNVPQPSSDGTWQFALDTNDANVGSYEEYNTGYIPTLVVIDINGNINHRDAGVHTKSQLMEYVQQSQNPSSSQNLGKAPDFSLVTFSGETFKLSNNRGKVVILDLMAVRCPPCHQQMPELFELKKELGDSIVILSIDVDAVYGTETADDVREAFGEYINE